METKVLLGSGSGVIGIAILASIQAAVVHANVNTCHASTLFPLILILGQSQGLTDDSFQQLGVDTVPMPNAEPG